MDYVGLVFYPNSPRYISINLSRKLLKSRNKTTKIVALTVDPNDDFLKEIRLDYNEYYFIPCDHKDITKRMLTNLIYSYRKSENTQIKNDLKSILELYK